MLLLRKTMVLAVISSLLSAPLSANSVGLARSADGYRIAKAAETVDAQANLPVIVSDGDEVTSGKQMVRIEGMAGQAILLNKQSSLQVQNKNEMTLKSGEVAVAIPAMPSNLRLQVSDLSIEPIEMAEGEELTVGTIALDHQSDDEVLVMTQGRPIRVSSLPDGNQVAVLGNQEVMRFIRGDLGKWTPMLPLAQTDDPTQSEEAQDEDQRDEGFFAFLQRGAGGSTGILVGGAAAAVGGVLLFFYLQDENSNSNDNNGNNQGVFQPPSSPTNSNTPVPTPVPLLD